MATSARKWNPPRPVAAFDPATGQRVGTFPSIRSVVAARHDYGNVWKVLEGRRARHHSLIWRDAAEAKP